MRTKIKFAIDFASYALKGGIKYYSWLLVLSFFALVGLFGIYEQFTKGLIVTGMTDQIPWGLYESNFIFLVGVAAAAVTMVFPSYIYHHKHLKSIVVLGEMLAIAAVTMVIMFIFLHMGRPDRFWHMFPIIGIFNFPGSMLQWDALVLNGYLGLNVICAFYYLYKKYTGQPLNENFLYDTHLYFYCLGVKHSYGNRISDEHNARTAYVVPYDGTNKIHNNCLFRRSCIYDSCLPYNQKWHGFKDC